MTNKKSIKKEKQYSVWSPKNSIVGTVHANNLQEAEYYAKKQYGSGVKVTVGNKKPRK